MQLSTKARKGLAAGLAASTVLMTAAAGFAPAAFAAVHSNGCLVLSGGIVWLITNGQRRGFTSAEVFMSHGYNFGQVVPASSEDVDLPVGPIMIYADGTLVKGPVDPLVYLVVNGQKRGFTSGSVFTGLGYSFANIQWAPINTFSDLPTGANIDSTSISGLPASGPGPQSVVCTTGTGGGPLTGGAGNLEDATFISSISNEDIGEDAEDVGVYGVELEADDGSDLALLSVKVEFEEQAAGGSRDLEDYLNEVTIWLGSTQIGSADVEDFDDDATANVWQESISLSGATIGAGDTEDLKIAVSALNNIDSSDIGSANNDWLVGIVSLRYRDAQGAVVTDTSTGVIGSDLSSATTNTRDFQFETSLTANNVELDFSLSSDDDDINDAHVINVDDEDETEGIEVLSFVVENTGDSDVNISEIPVVFTVNGSTTDESVLLNSVHLRMNGDEIATEDTVATGGAVVFDDLNVDVDAGEEVEFIVTVDVPATDDSLNDGDTVQATVTVDATVEAEDEDGEDLTNSEFTGSAVGDTHAMYDVGFQLEFVSSSESKTASDTASVGDLGAFEIKYDITAFDGDIFIDNTCVEDNNGSEVSTATSFSITNDGSNTPSCVVTSTAEDDGTGTAWIVEEGTTETFTLSVNAVATGDAFAQVALEAIGWDVATGGDAFAYTFSLPGDDFKTDPIFLNLP